MGSIYRGTRKIWFFCSLQEEMSSEWVGDAGSASVSNHLCAGWLREYAERDAATSMAQHMCIVLHFWGKVPLVHLLPWHISFPRLGFIKLHDPGTYIITKISMTQAQKLKYARSQQSDILFFHLLLNLSYHRTLTDSTNP